MTVTLLSIVLLISIIMLTQYFAYAEIYIYNPQVAHIERKNGSTIITIKITTAISEKSGDRVQPLTGSKYTFFYAYKQLYGHKMELEIYNIYWDTVYYKTYIRGTWTAAYWGWITHRYLAYYVDYQGDKKADYSEVYESYYWYFGSYTHTFSKELPDETYVKAICDGRFANRDWDPSPINSDWVLIVHNPWY